MEASINFYRSEKGKMSAFSNILDIGIPTGIPVFNVWTGRVSTLLKKCKCGETMDIRLRTVIYSSTVEIDNVPIFSCDECFHTEILTEVKPELARLISELGSKPRKQKINFDEMNEWAHLITKAIDRELMHVPIHNIIGERVDQLLDLMLLAQSLGDKDWEEDLRARLSQITKPALTT